GRKIDPVHESPLLRCGGGQISWSRRHIEKLDARSNCYRVEHRRDRLNRQASKRIRVMLRCALPASQLEAAKRGHVNRRWAGGHERVWQGRSRGVANTAGIPPVCCRMPSTLVTSG